MAEDKQKRLGSITAEDIEKVIRKRAKHNSSSANEETDWKVRELGNALATIGGNAPFSRLGMKVIRSELKSCRIKHGCPSLYFSTSPTETTHELGYIMNLEDPTNDYYRSSASSKNQVGQALFFHILIEAICNELIGSKNNEYKGTFGKITCWFGVVESQVRGRLHLHILIWLEGAMGPIDLYKKLKNDKGFEKSMLKYLNRIISTDKKELDFPCIPEHNRNARLTFYIWMKKHANVANF